MNTWTISESLAKGTLFLPITHCRIEIGTYWVAEQVEAYWPWNEHPRSAWFPKPHKHSLYDPTRLCTFESPLILLISSTNTRTQLSLPYPSVPHKHEPSLNTQEILIRQLVSLRDIFTPQPQLHPVNYSKNHIQRSKIAQILPIARSSPIVEIPVVGHGRPLSVGNCKY